MDFLLFTDSVIKAMEERLGDKHKIYSTTVRKNNGIILTGIVIEQADSNTSPTIYMDELYSRYQNGTELEEINQTIYEIYQSNRCRAELDLSDFSDYTRAKHQIGVKLINYEKNKDMLQEVPHIKFLNLAAAFYYTVKEPPFYGKAAITIHHSHIQKWNISTEELYQDALLNTPVLFPCVLQNMEEIMLEMMKSSSDSNKACNQNLDEGKEFNMYVVSNSDKLMGAACMLYPGVLEAFAMQVDSDFLVLPSSIHEVILVPVKDKLNNCKFLEIVKEINANQVDDDEILADSIYYYSRNTREILVLS